MAYDDDDGYDAFSVRAVFTVEGTRIRWRNAPEHELERILPKAREHAAALKGRYRTVLDESDHTNITLDFDFKGAGEPDRVDLIQAKADAFGVLVDTSWGGGG